MSTTVFSNYFHAFLNIYFQYICENHFQRLSKTSIFTGLKAVNHFGRPDMTSFLKFVQKRHSYVSLFFQLKYVFIENFFQVSKIGVFSCGPRPLTKSVMSACDEVNKCRKLPYFIHHFENFGWILNKLVIWFSIYSFFNWGSFVYLKTYCI